MSNFERPDPRDRPPDPAGTQPRVSPESLLPQPVERPIDGSAFEEPEDAQVIEDGGDLLPDRVEPAGDLAGAVTAPESPHSPRFQFLFGALLAIGIVAVALTGLVIATGGSDDTNSGWSPWRPSGDGAVTQIAEHVAREYRLPDGGQLVAVTGGKLEVAGLPMQIALREDAGGGGDINLLEGDGVLYRLCGLGAKCAIDRGKASQERHLLLRREALELALYTFRYVGGVDQVVVFMPPRLGQDPDQALLFRRGDIAPELARPLRTTLSRRTPSVAGVATAPDSPLVNKLTTATLYQFSLTQANQDASVFLVLEPFDEVLARQQQNGATGSGAGSSGSSGAGSTGSSGTSGSGSGSTGSGDGTGAGTAKKKSAHQ